MVTRFARMMVLVAVFVGFAIVAGPPNATASAGCSSVWRTMKGPPAGDENERNVAVSVVSASDIWVAGDEEKQLFLEHWDGTSWTPTSSPVGKDSHPSGIDAVSSTDIWVAGYQGGTRQALILHGDGRTWTQATITKQGGQSELDAVSASGSNDVWAVGAAQTGTKYKALAMHWNGSYWTTVATPDTGAAQTYLDGVVARSASDAWAVGSTYDGSRYTSLIEHWNGSAWSIVASPNQTGDNQLTAVTAVTANDVWAVGGASSAGVVDPLAMHWNGTAWSIVNAPKAGGNSTMFEGISAAASADVWAVGAADDGTRTTTVTEHWNGTNWQVVPSPNPGNKYDTLLAVGTVGGRAWAMGTTFAGRSLSPLVESWDGTSWTPTVLSVGAENYLRAISSLSASSAWAVGSQRAGAGWRGLVERWTGSSWSVVPSPTTGGPYDTLTGVAAVSANDVWTVGQSFDGTNYLPLVEHWDGTGWQIVSTQATGTPDSYLQSVAAVSANNVWAVGETFNSGTGAFRTLAEHWDGTAWSVVSTPGLGGDGQFSGVSAVSANDVWAVGSQGDPQPGTLVEHWNGTAWSVVTSATPGDMSALTSVSALSPSNAWAVGYRTNGGDTTTLAEHWDGTSWSAVPIPSPGEAFLSILLAVDARQGNDVWAAGFYNTGAVTKTVVLHWDGSIWSLSPTPNFNDDDSNEFDGIASPAAGVVWAVGNQEQLGMSEVLCPVNVLDSGFQPTPATVAQGTVVPWAVPASDAQSHTITDATKMGLFDSGTRAPGSLFTYTFTTAGVYKEIDKTTGHKGTIRVSLVATPVSGKTIDSFTIQYGADVPPAGTTATIQIKRPGSGVYVAWQSGLTGTSLSFLPDAGGGSYSFRCQLVKTSNGAHSGWAKASISVS